MIFNIGLFTSLQNVFYVFAACLLSQFGNKNEGIEESAADEIKAESQEEKLQLKSLQRNKTI